MCAPLPQLCRDMAKAQELGAMVSVDLFLKLVTIYEL